MFQIWVRENLRQRKSNERKIIWKIFLTWWKKNWTKIIPSIRIFQTQTFELLLKEGNWKCNSLFEERKACDPLIFPFQLGAWRGAWRGASLAAQRLKRLPAMWETWARSLGWEDPLEKEMAAHSSILAWRTPWMAEPGGLQSAAVGVLGRWRQRTLIWRVRNSWSKIGYSLEEMPQHAEIYWQLPWKGRTALRHGADVRMLPNTWASHAPSLASSHMRTKGRACSVSWHNS